ncbi:hypothetical protein K457DRAFT_134805 [Linnemannia elongata AG-77]|uniref:Uncharacterized protein n=1 Tax=Linnemannia elongata AG-77 TaxID=1314771 RepID=A0A197K697_9FUNG|nr:hypothetical protein K457DRAFT_134805 [Linnemannia elongata AG-77]
MKKYWNHFCTHCIVESPHNQAVAKHLGKLCKALSTLSAATGQLTKVSQITAVLL